MLLTTQNFPALIFEKIEPKLPGFSLVMNIVFWIVLARYFPALFFALSAAKL